MRYLRGILFSMDGLRRYVPGLIFEHSQLERYLADFLIEHDVFILVHSIGS